MRLTHHESERYDEDLVTKIVVDVQDPAAPVFEAARRGKLRSIKTSFWLEQ
jgi:hypothetical protein